VTNGSFGAVNVLSGGSASTTATLTFACTGMVPAVPVTLCPSLDGGSGGGTGSGGRLLSGSGGTIPFQIYQDAAETQPWGSATLLVFGTVPTITIVPDLTGKASTTQSLYGQISAAQTTPPGTYSSTFSNESFLWGLNLLSCAGVTVGTLITPAAFTFSVTVISSCSLTATNMAFGTVGLLTSAKTAQNQITATCTATTPYTIGLNNGLYGSAPAARQMANGSNRVTYGIYKDSGYTQIWGDLTLGTTAVQSATGTGGAQSFNGYGQVPAQTTPTPGPYSDTVVATVTY
jgi:spore coat protein U-like protein